MTNEQVELAGGDTVDKRLFDDLEERIESEESSDFQENRFERGRDDDPVSPFTTRPSTITKQVAGKHHADRSRQARTADESFNAPIAPNYRTWRKNPDRYDLPGVDTIPGSELNRRGQSFLEKGQDVGAIERVQRKNLSGSKKGEFKAKAKNRGNPLTGETGYETAVYANKNLEESTFPSFGEGSVLAHETGHAVDFQAGGDGAKFLSGGGFFARNEGNLFSEAYDLSERLRGRIDKQNAHYREDERELIADSIAALALEPRAARREAPNLASALEREIDRKVGEDDESVFDF